MRFALVAALLLTVSNAHAQASSPWAPTNRGLDGEARTALIVGAAPLATAVGVLSLGQGSLPEVVAGGVLVGPAVGWMVAGHPERALPGLVGRLAVVGGTAWLAGGRIADSETEGELFVRSIGASGLVVLGVLTTAGVAALDTVFLCRTLEADSDRRAREAWQLSVAPTGQGASLQLRVAL